MRTSHRLLIRSLVLGAGLIAVLLTTPALTWAAQDLAAPWYGIAQIFAEPGLTGYHPEQVEWSPNGRDLTYLLRRAPSGRADLYIVATAGGRISTLLSSAQLASAAAPPSAIKNQIKQERITR